MWSSFSLDPHKHCRIPKLTFFLTQLFEDRRLFVVIRSCLFWVLLSKLMILHQFVSRVNWPLMIGLKSTGIGPQVISVQHYMSIKPKKRFLNELWF